MAWGNRNEVGLVETQAALADTTSVPQQVRTCPPLMSHLCLANVIVLLLLTFALCRAWGWEDNRSCRF